MPLGSSYKKNKIKKADLRGEVITEMAAIVKENSAIVKEDEVCIIGASSYNEFRNDLDSFAKNIDSSKNSLVFGSLINADEH